MLRSSLVLFSVFLLSCGGPQIVPTTSDQCSTDSNVRETCWTCASEPACVWWGTEDVSVRGCATHVLR